MCLHPDLSQVSFVVHPSLFQPAASYNAKMGNGSTVVGQATAVAVEKEKDTRNFMQKTKDFVSSATTSGEEKERRRMVSSMESVDRIPQCSDKSLALLKAHFEFETLRRYPSNRILDFDAVREALRTLRAEIQLEGLVESGLDTHLEALDASIETLASGGPYASTEQKRVQVRQSKDCLSKLEKLTSTIRPLDMDYMLELMNAAREGGKKVRGKDAILLVGGTGAGKSTTVHFLCKSVIEKKVSKDEEGDENEYYEPTKFSLALKDFHTSDRSTSETATINAVDYQYDEAHSITIVDTPGFGDTKGAEQDIANGIGIANAMKVAYLTLLHALIYMVTLTLLHALLLTPS